MRSSLRYHQVRDKLCDSPLHVAIKSQRIKDMQSILQQPLSSIELLTPDNEGMTPLHLAVQQGNFEIYKLLINALSKQNLTALACRKINNKCKLPIDDVVKSTDPQKKRIRDHLLQLMIDSEKYLKPSCEPISLEEVIKENEEEISKHPDLKNNLITSVLAANIIRKNIKQCATHPECNQLSKGKVKEIDDNCSSMRRQRQKDNNGVFSMDMEGDQKSLQDLFNIFKIIKETSAGKCYEYAAALMHVLISQCINSHVELYETSGDHIFVVIGRKAGSDINNFDKWGPSAVVVDVLAGTVFTANKIPQKLRDFVCYTVNGRLRQFTYPFQRSNFHFLQPLVTNPITLSEKFFSLWTSKSEISNVNEQKLSKQNLNAACYLYTKYKDEWLGLRWFRCSNESCDVVSKLKTAPNDEQRYIIAIAFINQYPDKAFAKKLAAVMNYEPIREPKINSQESSNQRYAFVNDTLDIFFRRVGLPQVFNPFRYSR